MFGRPPEGGLLSSCDGVGWTAAKCSGVFRRWAEHERRLLALRRLRWADRVCCGCPPHCFGLRSRTANLASNLCHELRLKPMRARFSTLP